MPNIASLLKSEIQRVARKEIRAEIESLRKASTQQRSHIAALRKRIEQLEKELSRERRGRGKAEAEPETESGPSLRFRAGGFASLRKKLGLSAAAAGQLLNVTGQTIYAWETGKSRPRRSQLEAIAQLRKMGKREVAQRLEQAAA